MNETELSESLEAYAEAALQSPTRPRTYIKPVHNAATARLSIYGLAVVCPNPSNQNVEIGFIGHGHGALRIRISDGTGTAHPKHFLGNSAKKYHVAVMKTQTKTMGSFYEDGRLYPVDAEDCRWMPDLHLLHPGVKPKSINSAIAALVSVKDGVFYTGRRSVQDAVISEVYGRRLPVKEKIGRLLGADISCDPDPADREVRVTVHEIGKNDPVFNEGLARNRGPWTIKLDTLSPPGDHMSALYDVVDVVGNNRFSLAYAAGEPALMHLDGTYVRDDKRSDQYACQPFLDGDGPLNYP